MKSPPPPDLQVHVHERGDFRLDGILRLIEAAAEPRPLDAVLQTLAEEVAIITGAGVVSLYLREGTDGDFVMRANVGLAPGAVGRVRLRAGEGITGYAAQSRRPVSAAVASEDAYHKAVPGIGEEEFPAFLAVPLLAAEGTQGVLVMQRRLPAFEPAEVALASALAAPFNFALDRASERESNPGQEATASRSIKLEGVGLVPGSIMGRVETMPTFDALPDRTPRDRAAQLVDDAMESLRTELSRTRKRLSRERESSPLLWTLPQMLSDQRFRECAEAECQSRGLVEGLREVARMYARSSLQPGMASDDHALANRAVEVGDLCLLIAIQATDHPFLRDCNVLLLSELLSTPIAHAAIARNAAAVVVADAVPESNEALGLLRAAGIPVIAKVSGLFAWARGHDRILVDATAGHVRINPSPAEIVRARHSERPPRGT
ncbi:MAG: GAF domain-containing protein [Myxococcales bacterium]|nr:GAF domain-containing protein [Myxococcales bacterium]